VHCSDAHLLVPHIGTPLGQLSCEECGLDVPRSEALVCGECGRCYHWQCFKVEGMPNRLGDDALCARRGDCRRPDFVCEPCNFAHHYGRPPASDRDHYVCYLDRMLTLDEFHKDSNSGGMTNLYALRQVARWGMAMGLPATIAGNKTELDEMPVDHRQLGWFFVDKARTVKFDTVRRVRSALWNYYTRMPGVRVEDIPTATFRFTHRFDGLLQRLGAVSVQDKVFSTRLLDDLVALLATDWQRARGETRVELALVNLAVHLYFAAGFRANEAFSATVMRFARSFVLGRKAAVMGVRAHLSIRCSIQTKEERVEPTDVPVSFTTLPPCTLRVGMWGLRALAALDEVGRGVSRRDPSLFLFAHPTGAPWRMQWLWQTHVKPRLEQLRREMLGGLPPDADLDRYGTNSPRRTWNTMAACHPNPVSVDLRERQARWRKQQKKRQRLSQPMASLYCDPDIGELLLATYWLSTVR
jgi:hypothetical protein